MKNTFKLSFLCLILFVRCELWNQPIISKIEDKLNELRAIHTIFVSVQPKNPFFAGTDDIPENAAAWAGEAYGLEVSGTNGLDETRVLAPGTDYIVDPVEGVVPEKEPVKITVTVRLKDSEVTTSFDITLLRPDEEYYIIVPYARPTGTVYANPHSLITGDQFKEAEEAGTAGVPVNINIRPGDSYILKDGSLASFTDAEFTQNEKKLQLDKNDECIFKQEDFGESGEKEHRTYLYAEFERADGVVMLNSKYYATLKEAIDAVVEGDLPPPPPGDGIEVVTGFTLNSTVTIPGDMTITLLSDSAGVKTITGNITIEDGGKLRLKTVDGAGDLNVSGRITVEANAVLDLAGAVSVNKVVLGNKPITVSGELSPSGGVAVKKIIAAGKQAGDLVLTVVRPEDRDKFIVDGWAVEWAGNQGILKMPVKLVSNGVETPYATLKDAVDKAMEENFSYPIEIRLLADVTMASEADLITLTSGHIKLVPYGATRTIKRGASGLSSLFTVESGASLTLGGSGVNKLIIDGGAADSPQITATGALVSVSSGGTLTMNARSVLQNNKRTDFGSGGGGGVFVSTGGTFMMEGGEISGNTSEDRGGGVAVASGTFYMSGGIISDNNGVDGGGLGIYYGGTVNMTGGSIEGNIASANGGGVNIGSNSLSNPNNAFDFSGGTIQHNVVTGSRWEGGGGGGVTIVYGTVNMSGTAKILGNSAPKGGGVFIETDRASLTKTGGTVYGNDDAANANEATDVNGGHALYKGGGTVNTNTGVTGTTDSTF